MGTDELEEEVDPLKNQLASNCLGSPPACAEDPAGVLAEAAAQVVAEVQVVAAAHYPASSEAALELLPSKKYSTACNKGKTWWDNG